MFLTHEFTVVTCGSCKAVFALPEAIQSKLEYSGDWFWCPNGCKIHYSESEKSKLKAEIQRITRSRDNAIECCDRLEGEVEHQKNRIRGYKGIFARARKGSLPQKRCEADEQEPA